KRANIIKVESKTTGPTSQSVRQSSWVTDHFICLKQERRREGEAQVLRGLEVDHQLILQRPLHREVARLGPFEDLVHISGGVPPHASIIWSIGEQAAIDHGISPFPYRREAALRCQLVDASSVDIRDGTREDDESVRVLPAHGCEVPFEFADLTHAQRLE